MPKHFRNLPPAQSAAFERIAIGQPPRATDKTLGVLLRKGLIYTAALGMECLFASIADLIADKEMSMVLMTSTFREVLTSSDA